MKRKMHDHNLIKGCMKRAMALSLAIMLLPMPANFNSLKAEAAGKKLTLKACRALAVQTSSAYESLEDTVESKNAAYESAVKALKLKEISMSTFRWSPLLNFQFPTQPNLEQASEFKYKPTALQYEIREAQHKMQDKIFEINETINNLYVEIVTLQETIAFNEKRIEALEEGLARNEAKLRVGEATQADVDNISKKLESTKSKVASDRRTLEANLKKMSKQIGLDVSTGYTFEKPYLETTLDRSQLEALINYTADRDETYYEVCIAETTAKGELTTNHNLVRNKYGSDANLISSYVNNALNGADVNKKAFKKDYKSFLDKIDSYWQGKKRIIFVKIPRLWFKGSMDGTRYMEDDPYVLYQNVLDYNMALNDKKAAREELEQQVTDAFNNYVSVKASYQKYTVDVKNAEENLKTTELKNRLGEVSFDEYNSEMESYEELQNSLLDAMKLYTTTLYSFDRLTCGGVSAILSGTDADMKTAVVGESYVEKNVSNGAYYTIKSIIQSQEFELSIHIPEDFDIEITDYELWVNNMQIDTRKGKDDKLRHLALVLDKIDDVKIRLYNGDKFIDDCKIDATEESGPLTITKGFEIKREEPDTIGTFEITDLESIGMIQLSLKIDDKNVTKYRVLSVDGKPLDGEEQIELTKPLKYLPLLRQSLDELKVELYGDDGSLIYNARFDSTNGLVKKITE